MNILIPIVQFLLFTLYTGFIVAKHGVQNSISESWYTLEKKHQWMFTIILCYGVGILQCLNGSVWFFLSGAFLCFVGVATDFKSTWRVTPWVHNVGAGGCITFGAIGLAVLGVWWQFIPIVASIFLIKSENRVWWIELVAFIAIFGGLIDLYFQVVKGVCFMENFT